MAIGLSIFLGCKEPCDDSQNAQVGDEYFTVEYLDADGNNYLNTVYNPAGIVVYLDTTGGEDPNPRYELISPGYENGKFGPFNFTERYINPTNDQFNDLLLVGNRFIYDYYIKKDTYGQDTLRVTFLLSADECNYFWREITYSLNGTVLPSYQDQQQAEIVITE